MLLKQLSSLKYMLKQGLAIRGHDDIEGNLLQLLTLKSEDCPELNSWFRDSKYFSPDISNEQIALMGRRVLKDIVSEGRSATWFAVITNEATDVS